MLKTSTPLTVFTQNGIARLQIVVPRLCFYIALVTVSSCANQQLDSVSWPNDIPPREHFISIYESDDTNKKIQNQSDYLTWVIRFYEGWEINPRGWNEITRELLSSIDNPLIKNAVQAKMYRLGKLASGEWCKNNDTRTVNTKHIAIWGSALTKSLERNETITILNQITSDVEALIAHQLPVEAITNDRFYHSDELELW